MVGQDPHRPALHREVGPGGADVVVDDPRVVEPVGGVHAGAVTLLDEGVVDPVEQSHPGRVERDAVARPVAHPAVPDIALVQIDDHPRTAVPAGVDHQVLDAALRPGARHRREVPGREDRRRTVPVAEQADPRDPGIGNAQRRRHRVDAGGKKTVPPPAASAAVIAAVTAAWSSVTRRHGAVLADVGNRHSPDVIRPPRAAQSRSKCGVSDGACTSRQIFGGRGRARIYLPATPRACFCNRNADYYRWTVLPDDRAAITPGDGTWIQEPQHSCCVASSASR